MKKWLDNEKHSYYNNGNWFCNIYFHDNMKIWHWSIDHENALMDPLDNRCYQGDTPTREQAKILIESMLNNSK